MYRTQIRMLIVLDDPRYIHGRCTKQGHSRGCRQTPRVAIKVFCKSFAHYAGVHPFLFPPFVVSSLNSMLVSAMEGNLISNLCIAVLLYGSLALALVRNLFFYRITCTVHMFANPHIEARLDLRCRQVLTQATEGLTGSLAVNTIPL